MAMVISKFHRLIQSRITWMIILVVIVFSFVIWGINVNVSDSDRDREIVAATMFGEKVSTREYRQAYANVYLGFLLRLGREPGSSKEIRQFMEDTAWQRIAALKTAAKMKLGADKAEVQEAVTSYPQFLVNRQFNAAQYQGFIQGILGPRGYSEQAFWDHMREEIILQKLNAMIQQTVLVPPADIRRVYHALSDTFKVEFVEITRTNVEKSIHLTDEQKKTHYTVDPKRFTVPPKMEVQYVFFASSNYLAKAEKPTEEQMQDYYNSHMDDYREQTKPANTNEAPAWVTKKFEDVKADIERNLLLEDAEAKADEAAMTFIEELGQEKDGKRPTFAEAAQGKGLKLVALPPFSRQEPIAGVDAGEAFNRQAFELTAIGDESFSDLPVRSPTGFYVLSYVKKHDARVPDYDEVKDEVAKDAFEKAVRDAVNKKAEDFRAAASQPNAVFADVARAQGLAPVSTPDFTAASNGDDIPFKDELLRAVIPLNEGEVSETLPVSGGALLVARVIQRKAADEGGIPALGQSIIAETRSNRARDVVSDWMRNLLQESGFKKTRKISDEEPPEDDAGEPSPDDADEPESAT